MERSGRGGFQRRFRLPRGVRLDQVRASMEDGGGQEATGQGHRDLELIDQPTRCVWASSGEQREG